jgi:hypothetical protein
MQVAKQSQKIEAAPSLAFIISSAKYGGWGRQSLASTCLWFVQQFPEGG